jgi:hypothetical protein
VRTPPHRLRCGRTRTPAAPVRALQARPRPCAEQCGTAPSAIGAFGGSRCGGARMRMRGGGRARASTFRTLGLAPPKCCSTCGRCSRGSRHAAQSGARACMQRSVLQCGAMCAQAQTSKHRRFYTLTFRIRFTAASMHQLAYCFPYPPASAVAHSAHLCVKP